MKLSNALVKLPELSATMRNMSAEMMKVSPRPSTSITPHLHPVLFSHLADLSGAQAGIMSEMVDDTMESLDEDNEELEEEAQEEVDKVLWQITDGKLGQVSGKVGALPVSSLLYGCSACLRRWADADLGGAQQTTGPTAEDLEKDEEMERAIAGLLST